MKVLVVGSGGREHSLVWKITQSPRVEQVYCAPGNAGISKQARCVSIAPTQIKELADFSMKEGIDLTLVGPEVPLTMGIVDEFEQRGLRTFGCSQAAAIIEGSKAFAKDFMKKYNIPTASFGTFTNAKEARQFLLERGAPIVVKADGLAAGKGVLVCNSVDEGIEAIDLVMEEKAFGEAGNEVVIEEFLDGQEASFLVFTDGTTILPMASSQDHKPAYDDDKGPNTGGMGAYSPAPVVTEEIHEQIMKTVMEPTIIGMREEGRKYKGILYAGLMIKDGTAKVLEFNCRFGDPEAQPLLMRMKGDLVDVLEAVVDERLAEVDLQWDPRPTVCIVMASGGYPGKYEKGKEINGLEKVALMEDVMVFHAGTSLEGGKIVNSGGRVLGVTALGDDIPGAIKRAYQAVGEIQWEAVHYRKDIGRKAINSIDR